MRYLIFILPVLIVAVNTVAIIFVIRRSGKLKAGMRELGKKTGAAVSGAVLTGEFEGAKWECRRFPGNRNTPPYLRVRLFLKFPQRMKVRRENALDRFAKKISLAAEITTNDRQFDGSFYIDCDSPKFAGFFFGNASRRNSVRALFNIPNMRSVNFSGEYAEAVIGGNGPALTDTNLQSIVIEKLSSLAKNVPSMPMRAGAGDFSFRGLRTALYAFVILLEIAGIASLIAGLVNYSPLDHSVYSDSFRYSVPAAASAVILLFMVLKGTSSAHIHFIALSSLSVSSVIISSMGFMIFLNGFADKGKAQTRTLPVLRKYISRSKDSTSYYVKIPDWRKKNSEKSIAVSHKLYHSLSSNGNFLEIKTGPGKFGYEWLVSIDKA